MSDNTFEKVYCEALDLTIGDTTEGPKVIFKYTDIPGCAGMFVNYTQDDPADTLSIQLEAGKTLGGDGEVYYPLGDPITITESGYHRVSLPGQPARFRFSFTPAGPGTTDQVSIVLCGIPNNATIDPPPP